MIATEEASTPEEAGKNKKKKVAVNIFWLKITNVVQVTMEKMIKMQKARKEEKPVAMLIKGGMLFKDGKTTEEKKVDDDDDHQDDHEGGDVDQKGGCMLFKDGKTTKWFMILDSFFHKLFSICFRRMTWG